MIPDSDRPYVQNPMGHEWRVDESGALDIFGFEVDNHNGPECVKCGYAFCHHCDKLPKKKCPKV